MQCTQCRFAMHPGHGKSYIAHYKVILAVRSAQCAKNVTLIHTLILPD